MKTLQKFTAVFAAAVIATAAAGTAAIAADNITVKLNGDKVSFPNAQPVIYEDRTLIPVRAVFEKAGWKVIWDQDSRTAIIGNEQKTVKITIDYVFMDVYDIDADETDRVFLDVAATIMDDSTMVPLRAICEAMGAEVEWDGTTQTVSISY